MGRRRGAMTGPQDGGRPPRPSWRPGLPDASTVGRRPGSVGAPWSGHGRPSRSAVRAVSVSRSTSRRSTAWHRVCSGPRAQGTAAIRRARWERARRSSSSPGDPLPDPHRARHGLDRRPLFTTEGSDTTTSTAPVTGASTRPLVCPATTGRTPPATEAPARAPGRRASHVSVRSSAPHGRGARAPWAGPLIGRGTSGDESRSRQLGQAGERSNSLRPRDRPMRSRCPAQAAGGPPTDRSDSCLEHPPGELAGPTGGTEGPESTRVTPSLPRRGGNPTTIAGDPEEAGEPGERVSAEIGHGWLRSDPPAQQPRPRSTPTCPDRGHRIGGPRVSPRQTWRAPGPGR